jgi:hypothetical protein
MKTKLNSKRMPLVGTSLKTCLLLLVLFWLMPGATKAQTTGIMKGKGMSICQTFTFAATAGNPITPLNYGSQNYACTGATSDDISFNPQGTTWRVEKTTWQFTTTTTAGGTLTGKDGMGNTLSPVFLPMGQTLQPAGYVMVGTTPCVKLQLAGSFIGTYDQTMFSISAP